MPLKKKVKYIFVTGGVVSSLGKGITASSLGLLLKLRGYSVTIQKFDPYINVDPGTMSPYQHGEVYVLDDGAETDLDLGHYERFIDIDLAKRNNVTTGQIYWGAVPFVVKGADIMGPGIVDADKEINPGDFVWVRDVKNLRALAIGEALISGMEMLQKKPGKAIKSIHYVGDKLWKYDER